MTGTPSPTSSRARRRTLGVPLPAGILVLIASLVAMLCAVGAGLAWLNYREQRDQVVADTAERARVGAAGVEAFFADRLVALRTIAAAPGVGEGDTAAIERYLRRLPPLGRDVSNIGWVDAGGVVRVIVPDPNDGVGTTLADRPWFRQVMSTGRAVVSDGFVGRIERTPRVVTAVPTRDAGGTLTGTITSAISLPDIDAGLATLRLPDDTTIAVDRAGQIVLRGDPVQRLAPVGNTALLRSLRGGAGPLVEVAGLDGEPGQIVAAAPAPAAGWTVVVQRPADAAFAAARRRLAEQLLVVAVIGAIALVAAAVASRRLTAAAREQRRARRRAEGLHAFVGALAATDDPVEMARAVVEEGRAVMGADTGLVYRRAPDGRLVLLAQVGYGDELMDAWREMPLDAHAPVPDVVRGGAPLLLGTREEILAAYPYMAEAGAAPDHAVAAAPLTLGGRPLGGIFFAYRAPQAFDAAARELLTTLAGHATQALERARLRDRDRGARARTERLEELAAALASAATAEEVAGRVAEMAPRVLGARVANLAVLDPAGTTLEVRHSASLDADVAARWPRIAASSPTALATAVREGAMVRVPDREDMRTRFPAGYEDAVRVGLHALVAVPFGAADVRGALGMAWDHPRTLHGDEVAVAELMADLAGQALARARLFEAEQAARDGAERRRARAELQSALMGAMEAVRDEDGRAMAMLRTLVPGTADLGIVAVEDGAGGLRVAAVHHVDRARRARLASLAPDAAADPGADPPAVLDAGRMALALGEPDGLAGAVALPLVAENRTLGVTVLARLPGRAPYTERDLPGLAEVAARGAVRLLNARLFERERSVAAGLQRSLLAGDLPRVPGVRMAVRYRAGADDLTVGGDWYDVAERSDGLIAAGVGDVVGRGLGAATAMGRLRAGMGALALAGLGPGDLLDRLERFGRGVEGAGFATACVVTLDPAGDELRYACAGHPPPVLVDADGRATLLDGGRSTPLCIDEAEGPRAEAVARLPAGARLLLYTDGLMERRGESVDEGLERLRRAAERHAGLEAEAFCDALLEDLADLRSTSGDDTALVCLERLATGVPRLTTRLPADPAALGPLRRRLAGWLEDLGVAPAEADDVVLAVSEVCANAVEHGYAPGGEGHVEVEVVADGDRLTATVGDGGTWREEPAPGDRGRGLAMVGALMDDVRVTRSPAGTTVVLRRRLTRGAAVSPARGPS
jgi:serine/threonine-protein kinase RsbW